MSFNISIEDPHKNLDAYTFFNVFEIYAGNFHNPLYLYVSMCWTFIMNG